MINFEEQSSVAKYRELMVKNLGIFELRGLGRELGVPSPTTKKRNELVELILEKLQTNDLSLGMQSKKGRPHKKISTIDDILSSFTNEPSSEPVKKVFKQPSYEEIVCFEQNKPVIITNSNEEAVLEGVARRTTTTIYFVDKTNGNRVFIPDDIAYKYNISGGDFISGECVKINSSGQCMLQKVNAINFKPIEEHKVFSVELGNPIISNETLDFGNGKVHIGRRNLVIYTNDTYEDERFSNFIELCEKKKFKVIAIGANLSYENVITFQSFPSIINFTTSYGSSSEENFDSVVDAIALSEKLISRGESVVIFVNDVVEIARALDNYFKISEKTDMYSAETQVIIQKLMSIGRAYQSGISASVILTCRDIDLEQEFVKSELRKICTLVE